MRTASSKKGRKGGSRRSALGDRLTELRRENHWTLEEVSRRTGVGISTLSKIENNQVDVTFETLMKLCDGLDLSVDHLTAKTQDVFRSGVRTVTRKDDRLVVDTATYVLEVMSAEISRKGIIPTIVVVKARSVEEFEEMNHHPGEEFIYVIKGRLKLITEYYEPTILEPGDSAHYDSSMEHAFVSVGPEDAVVLSINHDSTGSTRGTAGHLTDLVQDVLA